MDLPSDFFTPASLMTFGGATLATFIVPNALQSALQFNPRWLGLAIAEAVCLAIAASTKTPGVAEFVVALINGCLVYCSAIGATAVGAKTTTPPAALPKGAGTNGRHVNADSAPRRGFLTPWF